MATVSNIDWPRSRFESSWVQQSDLAEYVDMMSSMHLNAVMFQARTAADAFYNSTIEPWSKYVSSIVGYSLYRLLQAYSKLVSRIVQDLTRLC